ncbi:malonyl-CoA decarboxylase (MCD), putative [Phytophthora infestans T30-4]|uniref:Malonyl-CoA decarboxylase (MCD), putative n=1 Tax=Phytophthora infestans (strain T30-4) TaxID=403677 RepID=D0NUY5_PHYIT|nr:malonyl-CoA decarboxylase (MCD), putative [Phytophthora infestans T30-4]EEY66457.1 malonyl-CoA decarboxylase (MCD), putative [Phytophthora infestans T30-4]|eukprot:XP_002896976.1 malonyl-CoA decarboxylase (MCD), putative [Phytophthora infestans T30-4]
MALTESLPAFCGDDEWVRKRLKDRDAERACRYAPDGGFSAVETVRFNRAEFTKQIQEFLDADVSDGFVIGLKRRRELALQLCEDYKKFTEAQRLELVLALAVDLGVRDLAVMMRTLPSIKRSGLVLNVAAAALGFSRKNDPKLSKSVKRGLVPLAEQFFLLVGTIQPGPLFLLNLRVDLGVLIERHREKLPKSSVEALGLLDLIMRDLFATQGSMRFRRIDLTSEALAAFVLKHERVHQVRGWGDLQRRLGGWQRYCFGLFHMHMPHAPLVFVQTVVTDHLCSHITPILEQDTPVVKTPSHVIFYSVSTSNTGLRGLNIASHLLFLTIQRMSSMFPQCKTAATLSPVPGFARWFKAALASGDQQSQTTSDAKSVLQKKDLKLHRLEPLQRSFFSSEQAQRLNMKYGVNQLVLHKWLLKKLSDPAWYQDAELVDNIRDIITAACARYILFERKKDKILDPVANFHLQNGAQVEQINFMADTTPSALMSALGMMINYRYCMTSIDVTSISYKRKSLAAVSPATARLVWPADSVILDELERLKDTRNTPLFAKVFQAGDVISARGSLPTAIYFIASGRVRVHSAHPYTLCEGQTFGERESLNDEPVAFTVRAETATHLLLLPYNDVKAVQRESSTLRDYEGSDPRVWQQQLYMSFHGSKL